MSLSRAYRDKGPRTGGEICYEKEEDGEDEHKGDPAKEPRQEFEGGLCGQRPGGDASEEMEVGAVPQHGGEGTVAKVVV
jgi:hypothetical protein